jgi:ubiquinone/menaquinone biosynthesis C-methylase UbiE
MKIDVQKYDKIARGAFAPVYPAIADQIIGHTGVTRGTCLDIGCGGGYLGAALAAKTGLFIHFFDASPDMLDIVKRTIAENGLAGRAETLQGDVTAIPLPDGSIDLAVSRGSVFFWKDLPRAMADIHRVLAPGGWAYIGGGFGSKALRESIVAQMSERSQGNGSFRDKVRRNLGAETRAKFEAGLKTTGIENITVLHDEEIGLWMVIRKEAPHEPAIL